MRKLAALLACVVALGLGLVPMQARSPLKPKRTKSTSVQAYHKGRSVPSFRPKAASPFTQESEGKGSGCGSPVRPESAGPSPEALSCSGATALTHCVSATASLSASSAQDTYDCFGSTYTWPGGEDVFTITTPDTCDLRVLLSSIPTGKDPDLFLFGSCDASGPSDCWAFGNNTLVAPGLPAGTYYLVVDDYYENFSYSCTVAAYLAAGTLLVDESSSSDVRAAYENGMAEAGYPPTATHDVGGSDPALSTLLGYKRVLWFTGAKSASPVLTTNQVDVMKGYLNGGGELMLVSQGYLHDVTGNMDGKVGEATFAYGYLQVSEVMNDMSSFLTPLQGVNGDPIGDDGDMGTPTTVLTLSTSAPTGSNPAGMETLFGKAAFRNVGGKAGMIWYDNGGAGDSFKVVYSAYPLENITPPSEFALILGRCMAFMENYDYNPVGTGAGFVDGPSANGLPDPGEEIGIEFLLQNFDNRGHDVQAYLVTNDPLLSVQQTALDLGTVPACTNPDSCPYGTVTFDVTVSETSFTGHRAEFTINYWLDGTWYDGPSFGLWIGQAKVFLIKDEQRYPSTSPALTAYRDALNGAQVTYAEYDTAFYGSPNYNDTTYMSNSNMASYGAIVWATGEDFEYTLLPNTASTQPEDSSDERELQTLLRNGGRLLLCSQDYFYDYFAGTGCNPGCVVGTSRPFPLNNLGISGVEQEVVSGASSVLAGQSGEDVCAGMSFNLVDRLNVANYCDAIVSKGSSPNPVPRDLFTYSDAKVGGLIYEGLVSNGSASARWATLLFPFENLEEEGTNTRTLLMKRLLYWFDFGDSKSPSPRVNQPPELLIQPGLDWLGRRALIWEEPSQTCGGQAIPDYYAGYFTYHVFKNTSASETPTQLPFEFTKTSYRDTVTPAEGECFYYRIRPVDVFGREVPDGLCP